MADIYPEKLPLNGKVTNTPGTSLDNSNVAGPENFLYLDEKDPNVPEWTIVFLLVWDAGGGTVTLGEGSAQEIVSTKVEIDRFGFTVPSGERLVTPIVRSQYRKFIEGGGVEGALGVEAPDNSRGAAFVPNFKKV